MNLMIGNQGGGNNTLLRDYRKGNWTLEETMVLIEAKKMDDERRMKRLGDINERGKPTELRWKWVEDYCWKNGCLRSQNQCNDKWDNLMRDFKKVREYEKRIVGTDQEKSYWRIEKSERKDFHLPSNLLPQIYEALMDVMERKGNQRVVVGGGSTNVNVVPNVVDKCTTSNLLGRHDLISSMTSPLVQQQQHENEDEQQQHRHNIVQPAMLLLPLSPGPAQTPTTQNVPFSQQLPSVDSDTSEYSDSPAKRRKRRGGEGTSGGGDGGGNVNSLQEVGTAISKSASIIAEALQSSEEREERRHREMLRLHERRLHIEESKAEINRQGINGLVDAVNKLANSILALAGNKNQK